MSPLVRSLLVFSCAALLRAVCATYPEYDPKHCTKLTIGDRSGHIVLDRKLEPTPIQDGEVEIPQLHRLGIELAEETVIVCQWSVLGFPPIVLPPPKGFSPIEVHPLQWFNLLPAKLEMTVYQSYKIVYPDNYHY